VNFWSNIRSEKLLNAVLILIAIILIIQIFQLIPWQYIRLETSIPIEETVLENPKEFSEREALGEEGLSEEPERQEKKSPGEVFSISPDAQPHKQYIATMSPTGKSEKQTDQTAVLLKKKMKNSLKSS
jgi:hypothetical protein